jgi:hypothetical protein
MTKETIKSVFKEAVTGFVINKPSETMLNAYSRHDTERLKTMHDRWASDHQNAKSSPDTSEKLLAVHHILKNRGEKVADLPQHPNLGMKTYNESIGVIGTNKFSGPQFYGAVPRSSTAKMRVSGMRKKAEQRRLNKLEEEGLNEWAPLLAAAAAPEAAAAGTAALGALGRIVASQAAKKALQTGVTRAATSLAAPTSGAAASGSTGTALTTTAGGAATALAPGRITLPSTKPSAEPEIIPPSKPSPSVALAPRVGRIIDVKPVVNTKTQALPQAQPQRQIPSDTKTKPDNKKKPRQDSGSEKRGRIGIQGVSGPQDPGNIENPAYISPAQEFPQSVRESNQDMGSEERKKIKYVERNPDAKKPTDVKSVLGRQASVIKKIIDESRKQKKDSKIESERGDTTVVINPNLKKAVDESMAQNAFAQALTPHAPLKKLKLPKIKIKNKLKKVVKEW